MYLYKICTYIVCWDIKVLLLKKATCNMHFKT